jgi:hypothetical protein
MPTEKNIKMNVSVSKNIDKDILKKLGEAVAGQKFSDRLAGLKEAVKEGFEHTNPARVKMSPDESMEDETKDLYPTPDDIETLKEKLSEKANEKG